MKVYCKISKTPGNIINWLCRQGEINWNIIGLRNGEMSLQLSRGFSISFKTFFSCRKVHRDLCFFHSTRVLDHRFSSVDCSCTHFKPHWNGTEHHNIDKTFFFFSSKDPKHAIYHFVTLFSFENAKKTSSKSLRFAFFLKNHFQWLLKRIAWNKFSESIKSKRFHF